MTTNSIIKVQNSVIILAAGLSERMGQPKAFMKWNKHITFLEKLVNEYASFCSTQIVLVLNNVGYKQVLSSFPAIEKKCKIVLNPNPEKGKMGSLKLGIKSIQPNTACFVQNVDNPFTTHETLNAMNDLVKPDAYVVPVYIPIRNRFEKIPIGITRSIQLPDPPDLRYWTVRCGTACVCKTDKNEYKGKSGHPVLLGSEILKNISLIEKSDFNLRNYLNDYKRIEVISNDDKTIVNINTLNDYQKYFKNEY